MKPICALLPNPEIQTETLRLRPCKVLLYARNPAVTGIRTLAVLTSGRFQKMIEDLLQPRHLLIILAIALLFFGPQKLPELGKGLAQGIRSFKDSLKSVNNPDDAPPAQPKD